MTSTTFFDSSTLVGVLKRCVPRPGPESVLAQDLKEALRKAGIPFTHEAILSHGRVDLRVSSMAIELKVQGSPMGVLRQLARYGRDPTVTEVILVTTSRKISMSMPQTIEGKTLHVVYLLRI
jgi:signal recognition particle subunit SEC65